MSFRNLMMASLDEASKHIQRARDRLDRHAEATEPLVLGELLKDCARAQASMAEVIEEAGDIVP